MKDIEFVNLAPAGIYHKLNKRNREMLKYSEPLGILYLASYLRQEGFDVDLLDINVGRDSLSPKEIAEICVDNAKTVALPSYTQTNKELMEISHEIKTINNQTKIIAGGPHATFEDESLLSDGFVDFVIRKEGEYTLVELLRFLKTGDGDLKDILGLSYLEGDKLVRTSDRPFIENLDLIPFPARDLITPEYYKTGGKLSLITARGCPFECVFCVAPYYWDRKVRFRNPENISEEIDDFLDKYRKILPKYFKINFVDDNFTAGGIKRVNKLTEVMKKFEINYDIYSRVDTINDEIAELLYSSGCNIVRFGIESGSERILSMMKKYQSPEKIEKAIEIAKKHRLIAHGSFIIGYPTETEEEVHQTIDFSTKLPLDFAFYFTAIPYPGTELYSKFASEESNIDYENFSKLMSRANLFSENTSTLSSQRKIELMEEAYHQFYIRGGKCLPPKDYEQITDPLEKVASLQNVILEEYFKNQNPDAKSDSKINGDMNGY